MARRIDKKGAAPAGAAAASELAILHPNREVEIAGRRLVVREYGHVEGMHVRQLAAALLENLYQLYSLDRRQAPTFEEVQDLLCRHADLVVALTARACDVDVEWVAGLGDEDGELLQLNWWLANSGFFTRRVLRRRETARLLARQLAGPGSTTSSSAPDTAPGSTPSDE